MATKQAAKSDRTILAAIIYAAIVAVFWLVPPAAPITAVGMKMLGVFIATIVGWAITSNAIWVSFATLILLPLTGIATATQTVAGTFGSDLFMFTLLTFIFTGFLSVTGAATAFAMRILNINAVKKHPWLFLGTLLFAAWFLAAFTKIAPSILLMWTIVYAICEQLGHKPFDKFSSVLVFGVAAMAAVAQGSIPWNHTTLINLRIYTQATGNPADYLQFFAYSVPVLILSIIGYLLLAKFVFRIEVSSVSSFQIPAERKDDLEFTPAKKIALGSLVALVIGFLLPSILPKDNPFGMLLSGMGMTNLAAAIIVCLSLIKVKGERVFEFDVIAKAGIPWKVLVMIAAIMGFVTYLGNEATGINAFLTGLIGGVFANTSPAMFILVLGLVCIVLTNLMTNVVVAMVLMQAAIPVAMSLGIDPMLVAFVISGTCVIALLLPNAGAATIVLFANTEWLDMKEIYRLGVPTVLVFAVISIGWTMVMMLII